MHFNNFKLKKWFKIKCTIFCEYLLQYLPILVLLVDIIYVLPVGIINNKNNVCHYSFKMLFFLILSNLVLLSTACFHCLCLTILHICDLLFVPTPVNKMCTIIYQSYYKSDPSSLNFGCKYWTYVSMPFCEIKTTKVHNHLSHPPQYTVMYKR